jgi:rifampicin phosphotransferase
MDAPSVATVRQVNPKVATMPPRTEPWPWGRVPVRPRAPEHARQRERTRSDDRAGRRHRGRPPVTADEFPVLWLDPSDADVSWEQDHMHMPAALTSLSADYVLTLGSGFAYCYRRLDIPIDIRTRIWNAYAYFGVATDVPEGEQPSMWERRTEACRARIPVTEAYWRETAIPELRDIYDWVASRPVETMPAEELAETWEEVWTRIGRCWSIHFLAIRGPYQVLDDLADLYESVVPDAPPGDALALIGGGIHELHDVERRLEELAKLASATPGLAERLADGVTTGVTIADLAAIPGSAPFVTSLEAFLAEHGHLGQNFDDLTLASWAEEPGLLLTELAKRVEHPATEGAEARRERLAAQAEALAQGVRTALASDPKRLDEFEALLAAARAIGPLTETHNYWIDRMAQASLRRFAMRVGRRLAADGSIADPADILHLRRDEVRALIRRPSDRRTLIRTRRREHARWASIRPPRLLGAPTEEGDGDRFDGKRYASSEPDELRGTGASVGVARGTARVTLTQADFGSVRPGDIIVCPSSNPSWVPLFAIAGGLITDTGGVLSHAAVVAREFGLPAVVGTGDATLRIADGRLVELDGSTGTVRLL